MYPKVVTLSRISLVSYKMSLHAEQLTQAGRWRLIRSETFRDLIRGKRKVL